VATELAARAIAGAINHAEQTPETRPPTHYVAGPASSTAPPRTPEGLLGPDVYENNHPEMIYENVATEGRRSTQRSVANSRTKLNPLGRRKLASAPGRLNAARPRASTGYSSASRARGPPSRSALGTISESAAPVAVGAVVSRRAYRFGSSPNLKVAHMEYLGDVISAGTDFAASQFCVVQPGDPVSFPWLSSIAGRFEQYRINALTVKYLPSCPTSSGGTVIVAFDTNAQRATPSSKVSMLDYANSFRDAPWMAGQVRCSGFNKKLYTLLGNNYGQTDDLNLPGNPYNALSDIKTYAAGQILVATDGVAAGTVGEIWLEYDIDLINPGIFQEPTVNVSIASTAGSGTSMFSAGPIARGNMSVISAETGSTSNWTIELPPGYYMVALICGVTSADTGTMTASGDGVVLSGYIYGVSSAAGLAINNFFQVTTGTVVTITYASFSHLSGGNTTRLMTYDYSSYA